MLLEDDHTYTYIHSHFTRPWSWGCTHCHWGRSLWRLGCTCNPKSIKRRPCVKIPLAPTIFGTPFRIYGGIQFYVCPWNFSLGTRKTPAPPASSLPLPLCLCNLSRLWISPKLFITKTIYFDVPLAYVFGVVFGHMNANTGRMRTANYRQTLETWSRSDGLRMS